MKRRHRRNHWKPSEKQKNIKKYERKQRKEAKEIKKLVTDR